MIQVGAVLSVGRSMRWHRWTLPWQRRRANHRGGQRSANRMVSLSCCWPGSCRCSPSRHSNTRPGRLGCALSGAARGRGCGDAHDLTSGRRPSVSASFRPASEVVAQDCQDPLRGSAGGPAAVGAPFPPPDARTANLVVDEVSARFRLPGLPLSADVCHEDGLLIRLYPPEGEHKLVVVRVFGEQQNVPTPADPRRVHGRVVTAGFFERAGPAPDDLGVGEAVARHVDLALLEHRKAPFDTDAVDVINLVTVGCSRSKRLGAPHQQRNLWPFPTHRSPGRCARAGPSKALP